MTRLIRKCPDDLTYTLRELCPVCGTPTMNPHPAPYSPDDRYGEYRRKAREWTK
jgi:H/ACA ribonucleoprotein complex subunit 3